MAEPPKPYDQLTLLFECAPMGGIEECCFLFPAGCRLGEGNRGFPSDPLPRGHWIHGTCVRITDNQGNRLRGEAAVLCIAAQAQSIQFPAQIISILPRTAWKCQCFTCATEERLRSLRSLIGTHPSSDEP